MVEQSSELKRTLGPLMLWGLGVGYVISGMYFGWNLGLPEGGTLGFGIATFIIILFYSTFSFCYAELACSIPKAGGCYDYTKMAFGNTWAFFAGIFQIIEFVFIPPAIAAAIGAYVSIYFPSISVNAIAIVTYIIFTLLNISGVKLAAMVELVITMVAVLGLLIFAILALPHFKSSNIQLGELSHGVAGIFSSLPFAIWFFLGIEALANVAEETINPQKNILLGFGSALLTLIILCLLTFIAAVGVNGWETIVYPFPGGAPSDSPLPLALKATHAGENFLSTVFVFIGLSGLIASFHGIILAAGRVIFEFGRVGYAPAIIGKTNKKLGTPVYALVLNASIGILALLTGKTADIIILACFGALSMYIIAMFSFFKIRKSHPDLPRPFVVPFYPWFPIIALVIAGISFLSMMLLYFKLAIIYFFIVSILYGVTRWFNKHLLA